MAQTISRPGGILSPPLKWAGGKRWLIPHLRGLWAGHPGARLVEPFCGGLAVALSLNPRKALLNDINPHLINFYLWLKKGLDIGMDMKNDREAYCVSRDRFNSLIESGKQRSRESAELFYYLNRTGYNGLCRFNTRGAFNVPFGRYARINYRTDFHAYSRVLSRWVFVSVDFEEVHVRTGDFLYADPPYDVEFTQYSRQGFSWTDQERLAEWLASHKGPVVVSNQATRRIVRLYSRRGFTLHHLEGPRRINNTGDRTPAREILAVRGV